MNGLTVDGFRAGVDFTDNIVTLHQGVLPDSDYQNRLNLGELAPGLYFLRVHGKRKDEVKKIVIR